MHNAIIEKAQIVGQDIARKVGELQKHYLGQKINFTNKEKLDIVTEVDLKAENLIINTLKETFPSHSFNSEEQGLTSNGGQSESQWNWVIDPIDGTINYANGLPLFAVSLALKYCGETKLGIIYNPLFDSMYLAKKNNGAYLNKNPISCSGVNQLKDSVLSFMLTSHYSEVERNEILLIVNKLAQKTRGLRLLVSQSMELALIASGLLQGTVCIKSKGYSSAAGALLVQEAGGRVTDKHGNKYSKSSKSIIASNNNIHDDILYCVIQ